MTTTSAARTLPEATSYPDANIRALAEQFDAALQAYRVFFNGSGKDHEADAVNAVAQKNHRGPGNGHPDHAP